MGGPLRPPDHPAPAPWLVANTCHWRGPGPGALAPGRLDQTVDDGADRGVVLVAPSEPSTERMPPGTGPRQPPGALTGAHLAERDGGADPNAFLADLAGAGAGDRVRGEPGSSRSVRAPLEGRGQDRSLEAECSYAVTFGPPPSTSRNSRMKDPFAHLSRLP
jgi:hypothetical protein